MLNHFQDNYGQFMPHELLKCEEIVKKTIYNPLYLIETVFYAVEEILEFDDINGILYT